jgi:hypothetical protein
MDSDEEMQQIDSELPSFSSAAKGKGKAVFQGGLEDPAGGRDDTLPWYMKSLSRPRLWPTDTHTGWRNIGQ